MFGRKWRENKKHRHMKFNPGGKFHATANKFLFSIFPKSSKLQNSPLEREWCEMYLLLSMCFPYFYNFLLHHGEEFISCFIIISIIRKHVRCDALCSWRCPRYFFFAIHSKTSRRFCLKRNLSIFPDKKISFNLPCLSINYWRASLPPTHITMVRKH